MCERVYMCINVCMYKAQAPEDQRGKEGPSERQGWQETGRKWRQPLPVPLPLLPYPPSPSDFIQSWVWQNLAQEPENGRVSETMAPFSRPHLKSMGAEAPRQSPYRLRMDKVSISCVLLLSASLSLRAGLEVLANPLPGA